MSSTARPRRAFRNFILCAIPSIYAIAVTDSLQRRVAMPCGGGASQDFFSMTESGKFVTWTVLMLSGAAAGVFFNVVVMGIGRPMMGAAFGLIVGTPMFAFMRGL